MPGSTRFWTSWLGRKDFPEPNKRQIQRRDVRMKQIKQTLLCLSCLSSLNISKPDLQFQKKNIYPLLLKGAVSLCLEGDCPEIKSISNVFHYYYYIKGLNLPSLSTLCRHFHHKTTLLILPSTSHTRKAELYLRAWHGVVGNCMKSWGRTNKIRTQAELQKAMGIYRGKPKGQSG